MPTTWTNTLENTISALKGFNEIKNDYANILGIHLEGPFINPNKLGAQPNLTEKPSIEFIKKIIDSIIDKQHDPKITLAIKILSRYKPKTVSILNKKPNAPNIIANLITLILAFKLINCFFHSGGVCFSNICSS